MTVTIRDVLKADLVLVGVELLKSPTEIEQFRQSIGVDVQVGAGTATEVATRAVQPVTAVALQRERITLNSLLGRTIIIKEYPALDDPGPDWSRLAKVAACAIEETDDANIDARSFGYNFGLAFDVNSEESAPHFIGSRILTDRPLGNEGWALIGGACMLMFNDGSRRWTFNLEPQPPGDPSGTLLMLNVNLHVDEARMPAEDEIDNTLNEIWSEVHGFIARLREVEQS
jgi:hypothetical protein